jgi:ribonuclease Z
MGKLTFLGTGRAVPDEVQENTQLLVEEGKRVILVDCASSPVMLSKRGVDKQNLTDIFLTHFHPDHVGTLGQLLMVFWLQGRKSLLNVYGLKETIDRAEEMMGLYDWKTWQGFYPLIFHRISDETKSQVIHVPELRILASPVKHLIPTMGLRFEMKVSRQVIVYSSDTEPCTAMIDLAEGADILIHEGSGTSKGHSSLEQAALVAHEAKVKALYFVHYSASALNLTQSLKKLTRIFKGEIIFARDGMIKEF